MEKALVTTLAARGWPAGLVLGPRAQHQALLMQLLLTLSVTGSWQEGDDSGAASACARRGPEPENVYFDFFMGEAFE